MIVVTEKTYTGFLFLFLIRVVTVLMKIAIALEGLCFKNTGDDSNYDNNKPTGFFYFIRVMTVMTKVIITAGFFFSKRVIAVTMKVKT